ncbi:MAG: hypothetical protein AAF639_21590 [Chloroflexota bacterium]
MNVKNVSCDREHVPAIIDFAEEAEAVEAEMAKFITEVGSTRAAIEKFGRA